MRSRSRPTLVALWVALQLVVAAPLARTLAAAPRDGAQIAAEHTHDVFLGRSGDRPSHRLAVQSPPFLPPLYAPLPPPPVAGAELVRPRACHRARAQLPRFAGPRGPPYLVVS